MRDRRNLVLLVGAVLIVLVGVGVVVIRSSTGDSNGDPEGEWTVEAVVLDGQETPVLVGTMPTASFAGGEVQGSAGCNTFSGRYEIDGAKLTMGPLASTQMFCEEPAGVMDQETAYLTVLGEAESFTVDGDSLQIRASNDRRILFTRG